MKILHSADWHLGAKNLKLTSSQQQLLKDEMAMNIQELFRKAIRDDYDIVIICGDMFHSKNISMKLISLLFKEIEDFARPVIFIEGNHDKNFNFPENMPSNLIFLNKNNYYSYLGVNFYSEINSNIIINNEKTNILLLHGNLENISDNDYIEINKYLSYPFDYIALGHIHQYKLFKKGNCIFAYSGSLFSNGFDESGDKGFLEVVIENKNIQKVEFIPFAKRRYMICECDITGLKSNSSIIEMIGKILSQNNISTKDLVRVVLIGKYDENCEKSVEFIKNQFENFFYFEIIDKSSISFNIEKIKNEKLSFKYEFISLVENSDLNEEDKQKICEIGLEALKGEDLII